MVGDDHSPNRDLHDGVMANLHVQRQSFVWLATLCIQLSSCVHVAASLIVGSSPETVCAAGVAPQGAYIGIHLSVRLCNLKGLLRLFRYKQELHSSLQTEVTLSYNVSLRLNSESGEDSPSMQHSDITLLTGCPLAYQ